LQKQSLKLMPSTALGDVPHSRPVRIGSIWDSQSMVGGPILKQEMAMQRRYVAVRNGLHPTKRVEVRIIRKRLKVTHEQLASLVRTAGSIAAVNREARRRLTLPSI
jgi:hypothetical protein